MGADFVLHPLIHISPGFAQVQDVEKKRVEPRTAHFLKFNQNIVARPEEEKWGLKYVMHSPENQPGQSLH